MINRLAFLAVAALALPTAAASAAANAHVPKLVVQSVSAQRSAAVGAPVNVQLSVARRGRAGSATISIYLSGERAHVAGAPLIGATRVPGRGGARLVAIPLELQARIPSGQTPGRYFVLACAAGRTQCRASQRPITVTATPVNTSQLLAAAVAAHTLTPQQAAVYGVFAAFGDRRLPARYTGTATVPTESALGQIVADWPQLSSAQRAEMRPFFTPPPVPGSWASASRTAAASRSAPAANDAGPGCVTAQLKDNPWRSVARDNGHVRLWWLASQEPLVGAKMRSLLPEIEDKMWPRLHELMGRDPLPDGGQKCWHGIDSKLDIYVLPITEHARALTIGYPPRCTHTPAYIVFNSSPPSPWEMAHELMHAFQYAFHYHAACSTYADWDESTATWVGQYLYPRDNEEHSFTSLITYPDEPLQEADYGGWTFPYALEQLHGAATIAQIYKETEKLDLVHAIDAGVPGGLEHVWPEYTRLAWNHDPVSPTFREWDGVTDVPGTRHGVQSIPIEPTNLDGGASGHQRLEFPTDLAPLTRSYEDITFGPRVSEVTFDNTNFKVPGITVQALIRRRDGSTTTLDLTSQVTPVLCPQTVGAQAAEVVLVTSNASLTEHTEPGHSVSALASNAHCRRYAGTMSGTASIRQGPDDVEESWSISDLTFDRLDLGDVGDKTPRFIFDATGGTVTVTISGTRYGCAIHAGPITTSLPSNDGEMDLYASAERGAVPVYVGGLYSLPIVHGTEVCHGTAYPTNFSPTTPLRMEAGYGGVRVPADGVMRGSRSATVATQTRTFTWNLVPQD